MKQVCWRPLNGHSCGCMPIKQGLKIDRSARSRLLAERYGEKALTEVVRQYHPLMRQATFAFGTGKPAQIIAHYEAMGAIHIHAADESINLQIMLDNFRDLSSRNLALLGEFASLSGA